ncbi:hypothetical protein Mcup_1118 [Metallosphaera cuprina Ar-4]|uniref:Uncharacterized protein n=1 Tax=Metallosphaera cuprina (strain Ar-4) TaxID=1006006 RepID=F4G325_METCR|nr:hypothetical protein Mcup_1118 [Metallosphaera cuprina Ar-4]
MSTVAKSLSFNSMKDSTKISEGEELAGVVSFQLHEGFYK